MDQYAPIDTNDAPCSLDALAWARVAGLVEIHLDGSWRLTPQGRAGMLDLLGQAHPFDTRQESHTRRPPFVACARSHRPSWWRALPRTRAHS
jgi:hypothetical protein